MTTRQASSVVATVSLASRRQGVRPLPGRETTSHGSLSNRGWRTGTAAMPVLRYWRRLKSRICRWSWERLPRVVCQAGRWPLAPARWQLVGQQYPSHAAQVMLYMYAVPKALGRHIGTPFTGPVVYPGHSVEIPATAVDTGFVENMGRLVRRLGSDLPTRRVPSASECRFCPITGADCPEQMDGEDGEEGETEDFWRLPDDGTSSETTAHVKCGCLLRSHPAETGPDTSPVA